VFRSATGTGRLPATLALDVPRLAVARAVVRVGRRLSALHQRNLIHGDIKPPNVLLTADEPTLIDGLDLAPGERAAAFTPIWSAPEQALGQPVQPAADVYPLALMTSELLGGQIFGELRKYRSSVRVGGRREFDLFHDPHVFFDARAGVEGKAARAYGDLIRRGLLFEPGLRIGSVPAFLETLEALLAEQPPRGTIRMTSTCTFVVTRTAGGSDVVAQSLELGRASINVSRNVGSAPLSF